MGCEILDLQCIFVSEIIGSIGLTIVLGLILYFIVASKLRFGFDTTIVMLLPLTIILGLMFGQFSLLVAVVTMFAVFVVAWLFPRIIGGR